jgi:hypothetical protein
MGDDGDYPSRSNLIADTDYENFGWVDVEIPKDVSTSEF